VNNMHKCNDCGVHLLKWVYDKNDGLCVWCAFGVPYPDDSQLRANYLMLDQELQLRLINAIKI